MMRCATRDSTRTGQPPMSTTTAARTRPEAGMIRRAAGVKRGPRTTTGKKKGALSPHGHAPSGVRHRACAGWLEHQGCWDGLRSICWSSPRDDMALRHTFHGSDGLTSAATGLPQATAA